MSLRALQGPTGGGAPVGGSGTTNTIPRWDAGSPSTTLTDSGLIDNGTAIYTSTRRVGVDTSTTLANVKFQVGSASSLGNYQGGASGFILPAGNGNWMEFAENSATGTMFRISKDTNTGVLFNANGKDIGFVASSYQTFVSSSQLVLKTTGNVGIGTASPIGTLDVRATNPTIVCSNSATRYGYQVWNDATSEYRAGTGGSFPFVFLTGNLERARIDSTGRWYVGVGAVSPASSGIWAIINQPGGAGGQEWHNSTGSQGGAAIVPSQDRATWYVYSGSVGSEVYKQSCALTPTGIDLTGASATPGLKLPATPGNADTQTLDAYQEIGTGTPAEIALTLTCGTSGTITVNAASSKARVTRVGNKVIGHGRIVVSSVSAPLGRLSCTLTGCPQPFTFFVCETRTNDTTGVPSGNIIVGTSDTSATPIVYFDRYSPNTRNDDAAANIQAGTTIVFSFSYSV